MDNKLSFNILIVEDEEIGAFYLKEVIYNLGFENIHCESNYEDARKTVLEKKIDLAFMDINIKGSVDGIFAAHKLNELYEIPIIFTTAYSDTNIIADASDANIYGYMIKPFDEKDIEASLKVALKRINNSNKNNLKDNILYLQNNYSYDLEKKLLYLKNKEVKLTKKETLIIHTLCSNINQVVSLQNLKNSVWKDKEIASSTIRDSILRLRKKTALLNITTLSGLGYTLKTEE